MKKWSRTKVLAVGMGLILAVGAVLAQDVKPAHMHGPEMMGGDLLGRYADALDLTDAQKSQMKDIMAKEKPTMKPLMDKMFQGHKAMEQLVSSVAFDEAKVRVVAAQQAQVFQELAVQKARIDSEMMQVLTADQKTKLASIQQKHEQRFQKHSQESAPEPPPNE